MNGRHAAATSLAILFASACPAQGFEPAWTGLYAGGGGGYSTVSVETGDSCYDDDCWWGDYNGYDTGDGDASFSVHFGWRLHEYVALEVNYIDTGTIQWDEELVYMPEFNDYYNNRVDFSAEVAEVSILGILPFAERWEVYARLGVGFWDGTSEQRLDQSFGTDVVTRSVADDGTGLLFGIGGGLTLGEAWHLRLDLQSVTIDEDVLNANEDTGIDSYLFEVQYRFGASRVATSPTSGP